jgi:PAS domain S-box-containing protein
LPDSERLLKTLGNTLYGLASYWNAELHCTFANHAYAELFGLSREVMLGRPIHDVLGPVLFAQDEPYIRAALGGQAQRFEREVTKQDGRLCYFLIQYLPDLDGDAIRGFVCLATDITDLKAAEVKQHLQQCELRASEARFRLLAEATFEGIAITDGDNIIDCNDQLASMLGYTRTEIIGKPISAFVPLDEQPRMVAAINDGIESLIEHIVIDENGRCFPVEIHGKSLNTDAGVLRITAIRDISEQKQLEESLLLASARFESLLNANVVGVCITDLQGHILIANENYLQLLGYTRAEFNAGLINWKAITPDKWLKPLFLNCIASKPVNPTKKNTAGPMAPACRYYWRLPSYPVQNSKF